MNVFNATEPVTDSIVSTSGLLYLESVEDLKNSGNLNFGEKALNTEDSKDRSLKIDGQLHLVYTQIGTFLGSINNTLIRGNVTRSLLQIFTTNIEKEIVDKFMNIGAFIKSPFLMWHNN